LVYVLYAPGHAPSEFVSLGTILIAVLILAKHRSNIERLIAGEEPRLKFRR
jgi:glycerol-3-phosphate acyltransferase PlsY